MSFFYLDKQETFKRSICHCIQKRAATVNAINVTFRLNANNVFFVCERFMFDLRHEMEKEKY